MPCSTAFVWEFCVTFTYLEISLPSQDIQKCKLCLLPMVSLTFGFRSGPLMLPKVTHTIQGEAMHGRDSLESTQLKPCLYTRGQFQGMLVATSLAL